MPLKNVESAMKMRGKVFSFKKEGDRKNTLSECKEVVKAP